jgi:hypothetical protein
VIENVGRQPIRSKYHDQLCRLLTGPQTMINRYLTVILAAIVFALVFVGLMSALRPAKADYFGLGIGGGTLPLHSTAPRMPSCNPTVSEECRRLQAQRPPQIYRAPKRKGRQ